MKYILGQKIGMSQMFDKNGKLTPVTLVLAEPCYVLQKKTKEKEGYEDDIDNHIHLNAPFTFQNQTEGSS